ncbi:MAG: hypothetical protein ACI9R3_002963 [Verrucomicrobiales bacterium]
MDVPGLCADGGTAAIVFAKMASSSGSPLTLTMRRSASNWLVIKQRHIQAFVKHLDKTLVGFELSEDDHQQIISRISTCADEIMGGGAGLDG